MFEWDGIEQAAGGSRMPWEEQRERLIGRMAVALEAFARERCDNGDREWEKICREREAAVWKEAYEEFNYLVRSRSLWTPQFGEVLKKFHEARAGEERGTP